MILRKKKVVTATLILALGTAIFANWYMSKPKTSSVLDGITASQSSETSNLGDAQYVSATAASGETMASFKVKRDASHDEARETLNDIIKDSASSASAVTKANESLQDLVEAIKTETDLENLISAKIGGECLVIISSGKCQVIVEKGKVNANSSLQVKDLVLNQTDIKGENITIIELK